MQPPTLPPATLPPPRPTRRVSGRVVQGLLSMGVFLIAVSGLALYDLGRFHRELTSLTRTALPDMTIASELSSQLQLVVNQVERLTAADSHPGRRIVREDIDQKFNRMKEYVSRVETLEGGRTLATLLGSLQQTVTDLDEQVARRIDVRIGVDQAQTTVADLSESLKGLIGDTATTATPAAGPDALRPLFLWISTLDGITGQALRASRMQRLVDIRQSEQQVRQSLGSLAPYHQQVPAPVAGRVIAIEQQMEQALFSRNGLYPALVEQVRMSSRAAGLGSQARLLAEEVSKLSRDMFASITAGASANATTLWKEVERQAIILAGLALMAVGGAVGVYFYFRHFLTNRLAALNEGVLGRIAGHTTRIDDGGQDEISAIARSITYFLAEINRRQQDVVEREQQFRSMVQGSVQAILVLSADRVLYANPAFSHLFGLPVSPDAVPVHDLLPDTVLPLVNAPEEAFRQGARMLERQQARRRDGSVLWVTIAVSPIHWQGEMVRQITVMDVTQPVLAEAALKEARDRAEEAARIKSRFMATMSHEIRTPMNAILGLSHLALKTDLTRQQRDYLSKLRASAGILLSIINDILDFSKIEAGKMELDDKPFDLSAVLETLSSVVALHAADKSLEFLYDIPADVPFHLHGDSLRLEQILLNLTNNAVKFTERGEVVLAVRVIRRTGDGVELSFSVHDTGIGIPPDQIKRLFAAFAQADSSATRRFGGTGLGLAISRQLAEMMGGTIDVISTPGKGSVFTLTLPFRVIAPVIAGDGTGEEGDPAAALSPGLPPGLPVLVADGNATARGLLCTLLEELGARCLPAATPEEALTLLPAAAGGLALIDRTMPAPDGTPLSHEIQIRCAFQSAPPRLILLGYHGQDPGAEQPETLARSGLDAVLYKPLDRRTLRQTLAAVLSRTARQDDPPPPPAAHPALPLRGMTVLLAEDNEINQQVARELLEAAGAHVDVVTTGRAAVDRVLHAPCPPDVVLMDVQMPEMDGVEATRFIRTVYPAGQLPIIAVSAHTADVEYARCLAAGVTGYLMKPVDPDLLVSTVQSARPGPLPPSGNSGETVALPPPETGRSLSASPLPERLGPFDLAVARRYTDGREALLASLLASFRDRFTPLRDTLLQPGTVAPADLSREAHSLKSAAMTLGNTDLGAAAARLEESLRNGQEDTGARLDCHAALTVALEALAAILPDGPQASGQNTARIPEEPPQPPVALPPDLVEHLTGLRQQIHSNRLTARTTFLTLRPMLTEAGVPDHPLDQIQAALDRLEFNAAAILTDRLLPAKKAFR
ncbi:hybrid sensor histidine kinase/response regulator [Novispirillum itersonii]|uniref:histidine kinase n=1 Tax=Novispirillum itersonii TaxID=189 RepID=A0A7X0DML5_NOVIT|nr:response regulator [Novispirillum itersonii]MBB6209312.1 PAS domain S-box-containing protein [Novispirillum itersonii]